ncbi:MAG: hypothetical protein ACLSH0_06055 [Mediterraneibacter faecis]
MACHQGKQGKYPGACLSHRLTDRLPYLTFGNSYDLNDKKNGILGDGSEILAVELYYITPEGYEYQMVHYRVSVRNNKNFYADQVDTLKASGMDGFAGDKKRFIDKFQAWVE